MSPGGIKRYRGIFPTTKTHFMKGQQVAWEWKPGHVWDSSWYIDPTSAQRLETWSSSLEFVGRPLGSI